MIATYRDDRVAWLSTGRWQALTWLDVREWAVAIYGAEMGFESWQVGPFELRRFPPDAITREPDFREEAS